MKIKPLSGFERKVLALYIIITVAGSLILVGQYSGLALVLYVPFIFYGLYLLDRVFYFAAVGEGLVSAMGGIGYALEEEEA